MGYGQKIKQLRKQMRLTQDDLAERLDIARSSISKIENEKAEPDITTILKLSRIFRVPTDEILDNPNIFY